jgi:hydrophobe/amphiphile efflux-1 (HAE1) family protein
VVFIQVTRVYMKIVGSLARHVVLSCVLILLMFSSIFLLFNQLQSSFLPDEDKGFFMVDVQLPEAASLNRTSSYMDRAAELLMREPAIENVISVNGFSALNKALQSNAGMIIAKLKPWDQRKDPSDHQLALQKKYQLELNGLEGAKALVFGAPAIPGLGALSGFSFMLLDTQSQSTEALSSMTADIVRAANEQAEISLAFSTFRAGYPQIWLNVDRERAKTLGVLISDIFLTLQTQMGGLYVNDFNLFGKTYKVMVQADAPYRQNEQDLETLYVPNNKGEMIALSALVESVPTQGADVLYRYNTYNAVNINGRPNTVGGYSSGDAMLAMEAAADRLMRPGFRYDWTDSSFEERKSGNAAPIALALSLVFTFLFLAALYESFMTPFAIILSVPLAMIGAFLALLITNQPLSLYGQIGLVLLVGLAAKTAILIVEFAKTLREKEAMSIYDATLEAARLRFRPVMMTALSFAAGVFPLIIATGAASRVSLGLTVFGGTLMAAVAGTLLVPVFFKLVQGLREKLHGGVTRSPE